MEIAAELGRALPAVCRAAVAVSGADAFNVVQNNGAPPYPTCVDGYMGTDFYRDKCWTGSAACAFSYCAEV